MLTHAISTILQLLVFTLIPFIVYLISAKRASGFFKYIGLYKPTRKGVMLALATSTLIVLTAVGIGWASPDILLVLQDPKTVTGILLAQGFSLETTVILLMTACFKTSLSEEILFRGFIAKRLMAKLGYQWGNVLQATIFGMIHLALFAALIGPQVMFLAGIFIFSSLAGYLMQYINEKHSAGSIIPGWIAHGFGNTVSYILIAFLM